MGWKSLNSNKLILIGRRREDSGIRNQIDFSGSDVSFNLIYLSPLERDCQSRFFCICPKMWSAARH